MSHHVFLLISGILRRATAAPPPHKYPRPSLPLPPHPTTPHLTSPHLSSPHLPSPLLSSLSVPPTSLESYHPPLASIRPLPFAVRSASNSIKFAGYSF
ncbi:hypothetical protein Mp_3g24620 [Marchantia polymorpha subsp. ruderalis]|uniref:Uncharacterized protein n=2 Tax=Marchantia polymorpha TaxID=3197 RepID=A0AAF6B4E4_MARPO|nr:hypothetical protein MARPO_0224s0006 [Marchantia polymorpha]PTQ27090.1 hypothetical protein MARPO_0224s0006 [Marchantia polymorpha]BBN06878.1 hypothetical protein Mp_3g24620 [Marchantia polymorpha subsp. ruderalis]BBN06879.1 hypothetical protein Mp_3g24620 [Marchantia polymorpha subsp. ruderalis]|eukprot:PTQ27089.1 hypothetical protein MARPO_0224s0006 [Marchantia polymorpha]